MGKENLNFLRFPQAVRKQVRKEQQNSCAYCGAVGCIEIHHIVPSIQRKKFNWSEKQIIARKNAVGFCGGDDGCHKTFDILAEKYNIYFDDVMEDEGRPYPITKTPSAPESTPAPLIRFPERREISRLYETGDD